MAASEGGTINVDEEDVITQLFGAGGAGGAGADHEYDAYLDHLTSYSLEKLSKEPENLREQAYNIKQQMQSLSYTHYRSFIQTSNAIKSVSKEIVRVDEHLESLVPHLGSLAETCEKFALSAQSFVSLRSAHRRTLHNHAMLLELLEIPQLMDTCVRNGCYEEALQLESFAKKLAKSFPNVKVVSDIVSEIEGITLNLLSHLIHQLCTQIQFPVSLNAIGYLRRLQIYNELELRVTFLMCRDTWLLNSLSSIPDSSPYSYLNKLIDQSRTHLFDIINQYKAIFSDDSSSHDDPMKDGGLLYGWISQKITSFMKTLDSFLPQIEEGAAIGRLLDQCMSYGASLARVGVDVRGLLPPLFEKSVYNLFASTLTSATHHFVENIKSYHFSPQTSSTSTPTKPPKVIESTQPPIILLDYPPLAILTNAILGAYNELRQCAPLSLQFTLTTRLRESLVAIVAAIQSLPNHISFDTNQEKAFSSLCKVVCENFLPYIVHCFHVIYSTTASSHTPLAIDIAPLVDSLSRLYITEVPEVAEEDTTLLQNNTTENGNAHKEPNKQNTDGTSSVNSTHSTNSFTTSTTTTDTTTDTTDTTTNYTPTNTTPTDATTSAITSPTDTPTGTSPTDTTPTGTTPTDTVPTDTIIPAITTPTDTPTGTSPTDTTPTNTTPTDTTPTDTTPSDNPSLTTTPDSNPADTTAQ